MNLRNGMTKVHASHKDFLLTSASQDRIRLLFVGKIWDDILFEAANLGFSAADPQRLAADAELYDDVISSLCVHFLFRCQPSGVCVSAEISVVTADYKQTTKRFVVDMEPEEIVDILDAYFQEGGRGVKPDYLDFFRANYMRWKQSKK